LVLGAIALGLIACPTVAAHALCLDDIAALKERIQRRPTNDVGTARKELAKAELAEKTSESECRNAVARARRALNTPAAPACPPAAGATPAQVEQCRADRTRH
jgi:hypothetical protein